MRFSPQQLWLCARGALCPGELCNSRAGRAVTCWVFREDTVEGMNQSKGKWLLCSAGRLGRVTWLVCCGDDDMPVLPLPASLLPSLDLLHPPLSSARPEGPRQHPKCPAVIAGIASPCLSQCCPNQHDPSPSSPCPQSRNEGVTRWLGTELGAPSFGVPWHKSSRAPLPSPARLWR